MTTIKNKILEMEACIIYQFRYDINKTNEFIALGNLHRIFGNRKTLQEAKELARKWHKEHLETGGEDKPIFI